MLRNVLNKFVLTILLVLLAACGHRYAIMPNDAGQPVMLLGHDPVTYFTEGKPIRGRPGLTAAHDGVLFYFVNDVNRQAFKVDPNRYFPQYGGFCSSGAAYGLKLGSDPTEFVIRDGKIYFFGDVLGKVAWMLDPEWNIRHGDQTWPESAPNGWRWQSLKRYANKVPWYKNGREIYDAYTQRFPDKPWPDFNPGSMLQNLFLKLPGWRAREGFGQPEVGFVGVDPCPPACPGVESQAFPGH